MATAGPKLRDMPINHRYLIDLVRTAYFREGARYLDFGCGAGELVEEARRIGLDFHGADVFYEASTDRRIVEEKGFLGGAITEMRDGRTAYGDGAFDAVVCNQVLEHVADLDATLREIARVLRPGGVAICLFPAKDVWREGHTGIPFLHRFPKGPRARVCYAFALRSLGMGTYTAGKTRREWAEFVCRWLDTYTVYRRRDEIEVAFRGAFSTVDHVEPDYLNYRLARIPSLARLRPLFETRSARPVLAFVCRKLAGLAILSTR